MDTSGKAALRDANLNWEVSPFGVPSAKLYENTFEGRRSLAYMTTPRSFLTANRLVHSDLLSLSSTTTSQNKIELVASSMPLPVKVTYNHKSDTLSVI